MSAADYLGTYAEGWAKGDASTILKAVSDDYTFDDPNAGKIGKSHFAEISFQAQGQRAICSRKSP